MKSVLNADFTMDPFADPSVLTNPVGEQQKGSVSQFPGGTEYYDAVKPSESYTDWMNLPYHQRKNQNKVSVSSQEKKGSLAALLISAAIRILIFIILSDLVMICYSMNALFL